jgi:selenide, water dikinase
LPVEAIAQVVRDLPKSTDANLLVGAEDFSDAGIYKLTDEIAIVQTVDFFPPVVDDPFVYGQIAAANSLSDCYAMGGKPITAMNIVGFPDDKLPLDILGEIMRGGADKVQEAGASVVGGHSVRDVEIKFGLSVTGTVHPDKMLTNAAAKPGDVLVLTKGLGTGFITTADRANKCPADVLEAAANSMKRLNRDAGEAALRHGVSASTDITGFGLAGHASEMALASDVTLKFDTSRLPVLPGVATLAASGFLSRANKTNRSFTSAITHVDSDVSQTLGEVIFDPQTSGGLLVAVAAEHADAFVTDCKNARNDAAAIVGEVFEKQDKQLVFKS